jgi:hypothetical protein
MDANITTLFIARITLILRKWLFLQNICLPVLRLSTLWIEIW